MVFYVLSPLMTRRLLPKQTETAEIYGTGAPKN